jgi:DtxR family Mn-dependent transcriptional regulator
MRDEVELSEAAEEVLAGLWPDRDAAPPECHLEEWDDDAHAQALGELSDHGLVVLDNGTASLTSSGREEAASVIRRERLAERLLVDVLDVSPALATETACKFEHLLRRGIDDEICTLLGHPRICPHGRPIPPGPCCRDGAAAAGRVISALADLSPGDEGTIAYLQTQRRELMQRLLAMGAIPGARVLLQQKFPSVVFTLGSAQIAIDEETARDIYVRPMTKLPRRRLRRRLGKLWRGQG